MSARHGKAMPSIDAFASSAVFSQLISAANQLRKLERAKGFEPSTPTLARPVPSVLAVSFVCQAQARKNFAVFAKFIRSLSFSGFLLVPGGGTVGRK